MLNTVLSHGVAAGLIAGVPLFALVLIYKGPPPQNGMLIGFALMLAALSLVFFAIRRRRDRVLGGHIDFWPAFVLGVAISVVASLVYAAAWEVTLAVSKLDFGTEYARIHLDQQKALGASEAEMIELAAKMEQFKAMYSHAPQRFIMTWFEMLPLGLAVSLVSAALLRNPRFMPARKG